MAKDRENNVIFYARKKEKKRKGIHLILPLKRQSLTGQPPFRGGGRLQTPEWLTLG